MKHRELAAQAFWNELTAGDAQHCELWIQESTIADQQGMFHVKHRELAAQAFWNELTAGDVKYCELWKAEKIQE